MCAVFNTATFALCAVEEFTTFTCGYCSTHSVFHEVTIMTFVTVISGVTCFTFGWTDLTVGTVCKENIWAFAYANVAVVVVTVFTKGAC